MINPSYTGPTAAKQVGLALEPPPQDAPQPQPAPEEVALSTDVVSGGTGESQL